MKLSVIVPYYSGEQYLKDCIACIREGGYEDTEILVCDDDPMDPRGTAFSRNRGLERMTGDYCLFLDSDDYLLPGALNRAMQLARSNEGAVIELPMRSTYFCRNTVMNGLVGGDVVLSQPYDGYREDVCGLLIPASLIGDRRFNEKYRYFSGLTFVTALKSTAKFIRVSEPCYYKRIHNDPINLPSLSQEKSKVRTTQFCACVREALTQCSGEVREGLTRFFADRILCLLTEGHNPEGLSSWSALDHAAVTGVLHECPQVLENYKGREGKLLRKLASSDYKGTVRTARRINFKKLKKGLFGSRNQWMLAFYRKLACRRAVDNNMILFESFNGHSYGDSCRYIYEEYAAGGHEDRRLVWSIDRGRAHIPGRHREVRPGTLRYYSALARAGVVVTNMRQPDWMIKREGQFLLETWHGTPLKKLVFDMDDVYTASPDYKKIFYNQSRKWDCLLSGNAYSTDIFTHAFMFPRERIFELGMPRNDSLVKNNKSSYIMQLKEKYHIPTDRKIVLYAPTWRDDEFKGKGEYRFSLPFSDEFANRMQGEFFFILRLHYFVSDKLQLSPAQASCMVDMSSFNDINDLYLMSDILVTDYSSVFFDYAVLKRPMMFYAYDYERYRDTLRGFYFDMESYCPGPVLKNETELVNALTGVEELSSLYAGRYDSFRKVFAGRDDGRSSARVVEFIEQQKAGKKDVEENC